MSVLSLLLNIAWIVCGAPARLRDGYGSDDMAARTMPKTTTATAEAISTTAFPSPSTISNATIFHNIPPAEAEERYYAMLEQPAMAA